MLQKLTDIFAYTILFISNIAFFAMLTTLHIWGEVYFEQILISLDQGVTGTGQDVISSYIYFAFIPAVISALVLPVFIKKNSILLGISFLLLTVSLYKVSFFQYIIHNNTYTDLYKNEYINPKDIKFVFPKNKSNLIVLYLESMENDYANTELTGKNLIPNLTELAKQGVSFSGFSQLPAQDYTVAALVAGFCGIPYKYEKAKSYTDFRNFLPGAVCYSDILKENGYKNYLIKGTDLNFARTGLFFLNHGYDYVKGMYDFESLYDVKLENNQGTSWGYNDSSYYEIIKKQLIAISSKNEPFAATFITLDTHGPDIYLDKKCVQSENYRKDVILCADKMAINFIKWLQEQDFYKNTTVVIMGDHIASGKNKLYPDHNNRQIINIILNPANKTPVNTNRQWTTLDVAPTILNALGIEFDNSSFGLGRSLYSNEQTLYEKYGKSLLSETLRSAKEYSAFNKIKHTFEVSYPSYPQFDTEIKGNENIKQYAPVSDIAFNIIWLDTLSFTLPENNAKYINFELEFKVLLMEKNKRTIDVYANDTLITTLKYNNKTPQPIKEKISIPVSLVKDKKLKLEFKGNDLGFTAVGVGLGILNFNITQSLN